MQFINYFFASMISFLGLLAGIILIKTAPEEQKPLEKYFDIARKLLLMLIFAFLVFYYFNDFFVLLSLIGYFIFLVFMEYKLSDLFKKSVMASTLLGILFFLSSKNTNLFTIESSLMFLYGLPAASLIYNKKEKNDYKLILYGAGFIVISNLLFLI